MLDIVLVNWNSGTLLRQCLQSVFEGARESSVHVQCIVIDNRSNDDSVHNLQHDFPEIKVIMNEQNLGFGVACNQGAALGTGEHILFLNPDTTVSAASLATPLAFLKDPLNEKYGVVGIKTVNDAGQTVRTCTREPKLAHFLFRSLGLSQLAPAIFPSHFMDNFDHESSKDVDHVIGAFYMIRRTTFAAVEGFDPRFFVYMEDVDLSTRIRALGLSVRYMVESQIHHVGGGSSRNIRALRMYYSWRSHYLYARKHFGNRSASIYAFVSSLIEPAIRMLQSCAMMRIFELHEIWRAQRLYIGFLCD
jgi:N-acetylglucosaminyl-diphospho-decaprenol L-rhamnosyltransferase